jgi:uncharacterized protein YndB with AHSA1/START domain
MEIAAVQEIELPREAVWREIADVDRLAEILRARGGEVRRLDAPGPPRLGTAWETGYTALGQRWDIHAEIVRHDPPEAIASALSGNGYTGRLEIVLAELEPARTRLDLRVTLEAKTLRARATMQPLKLARDRLQGRLSSLLSRYARNLERRHGSA